ncbi:MAG: hypothetical protein LUE87_06405 [Lachnospiraceae bacterium]|nr:hypothetical protein [Lachnospiraceae bacterium]
MKIKAEWIPIDPDNISTFPPLVQDIVATVVGHKETFNAKNMEKISHKDIERNYVNGSFTKQGKFNIWWDTGHSYEEYTFERYNNYYCKSADLNKKTIEILELWVTAWWPVPNEAYGPDDDECDAFLNGK